MTALIPAVHAWPAHRTHGPRPSAACTACIFLSFAIFLFFFSSTFPLRLTSKFALSALYVARIMQTGNYGDAQGLPYSLPFSLYLYSFFSLIFFLSGYARCLSSGRRATVSSTLNCTYASGAAIRHPAVHPTASDERRPSHHLVLVCHD